MKKVDAAGELYENFFSPLPKNAERRMAERERVEFQPWGLGILGGKEDEDVDVWRKPLWQ